MGTFTPKLGPNHKLNVVAGWNLEDYRYTTETILRLGMLYPGMTSFEMFDGTAITLAPYGVSQLDENWAYPDNDVFLDTEIKSIVLTTSDGRRYNIMTTLSDGHVTTDLDDVVVSHSDFDKGNFYITFGTYLDVDSIDSVEINGVTYKE